MKLLKFGSHIKKDKSRKKWKYTNYKQLRPKVVNNYRCMSQAEDFDTLYSEKKSDKTKIKHMLRKHSYSSQAVNLGTTTKLC